MKCSSSAPLQLQHGARRVLLISVLCFAATSAAEEPLRDRIDQLVAAKSKGPVAEPASDGEFLRRVFLDLSGRIPSLAETRAFFDDKDADKRTKWIDKLLASDEYPQRMADLFHVMLMERLGDHEEWSRYLVESFRSNKRWDQMVREMLYPQSEDEKLRGAGLFLSKRLENYGQNPVDYPAMVRDVGRLFLGVDVQCAQCHDHLFVDDYKQEYYQGLYAFLGQVTLRNDVKFPAVSENLVTKKVAFKSVFVQVEKQTGPRLPNGTEVPIPTFAKGEEFLVAPDQKSRAPGIPRFSPLKILSEQLPQRDNALFSTNIVNRLWWVLMGRGIVHPLDLQHRDNPAAYPEVLDSLSREFVAHDCDVKWLLREIALSKTYQRSSMLPAGINQVAPESCDVFHEKPLSAEQLWYSVLQATGAADPILCSTKTSEVKSSSPAPPGGNALRDRFLKAFANPPREPEVDHSPSLKAALFLMHDQELLGQLRAQPGNLFDRLVQQSDVQQFAADLYLSVLTRQPDDEEKADVAAYLQSHADRKDIAVSHLIWSLLASTEFCVNH